MLVQIAPTTDPVTRLPIAVVDSTALGGKLPNKEIVLDAISQLPESDHVVLFFASGSPATPNIQWLHQTYRLFTRTVKKRIRKIYLVHGKWWTRTLRKVLGGALSQKFVKKIVLVESLSALATMIDITVLNISPQVYLDNFDAEDSVTVPKHCVPVFGAHLPREPTKLWTDVLGYLRKQPSADRSIFERTNGSPLVLILRQAYDRGQVLNLADYGPQISVATLKLYLLDLPTPLVPISALPLPIIDSKDYIKQVVRGLNEQSTLHLSTLTSWLSHVTAKFGLSVKDIATSFGPAITGLYNPGRDHLAISVRFTRNLIEHWPLDTPKPAAAPPLPKRTPPAALASPIRTVGTPCTPRKTFGDVGNLPAPPPQVPFLRAKVSLRSLRGPRVAELSRNYEHDSDEI